MKSFKQFISESTANELSAKAWTATSRANTSYGHAKAYNMHKIAARQQRIESSETNNGHVIANKHDEQAHFHHRNSVD